MSQKEKLVLYIGHSFDLAYFSRLIPLINSNKIFYVIVIVAKGRYFNEMHSLKSHLGKFSDSQIFIEKKDIPAYSKNVFKSIFNGIKLLQKIKHIDRKRSILISIDKSTFMANLLNSKFENVLLIQTIEPDDNELKKYYKFRYWRTVWFNVFNILTLSKIVAIYVNKGSKGKVHKFRVINPKFDVIFRNQTDLKNKLLLPEVSTQPRSKKILIFGSRYNEWSYFQENLDLNKQKIFDFYSYIGILFKGYEFLYKPHPKETGREFSEIRSLFSDQIKNVGNALNSELFLLENTDIEFCFSINSTSSISAYEMGFNSKVFYPILKFPPDLVHDMDKRYVDAQNEFFIKHINKDIKKEILRTPIEKDLDYINHLLNKYLKNFEK